MANQMTALGIDRLTLEERLRLVQQIWDSVAEEVEHAPLTPGQRGELERRYAASEADPEASRPWSDVKARLLSRKARTQPLA